MGRHVSLSPVASVPYVMYSAPLHELRERRGSVWPPGGQKTNLTSRGSLVQPAALCGGGGPLALAGERRARLAEVWLRLPLQFRA